MLLIKRRFSGIMGILAKMAPRIIFCRREKLAVKGILEK